MRVVQINVLAKEKSTGRTTSELHNYLIQNGHSSYVAYGIGKRINDSSFFRISGKIGYYIHNLFSRLFGKQGYFSNYSTKKLLKWMDKIQPDIVHLRNLHSNYINLDMLFDYLIKKDLPVVITTHDFWFLTAFCPYPPKECDINNCELCLKYNRSPTIFYNPAKIFSRKKNYFLKLNHFAVQANSYFSKEIVEKSFLNSCKIEVVYNWIDFNSFYPDPILNFFHSDKPVVLVIWSLLDENQERFRFFCKIAELLRDKYLFVMVGRHTFNTKKYPCINFYQGTNDIATLRHFYSSADVFFNPSTTDTFGKVVAESISCGTPCIVFNNQALPELVGSNECGLVVEPFDIDGTIDALSKILSKPKEFYLDKCKIRSRTMFDLKHNCSQLLNLYNKIIHEK